MTNNVFEVFVPMVVGIGFFALVGWIVFAFVDGRRRREQLKAMTDFHTRALDKMGSTADFGNFLETDGGKRFLKSLTIEGPNAKQHIVRGTERGILCLVIGLALMLLGWTFQDVRDGFLIIGVIVAACGVGNLISCVASYGLSKSFGLLNGDNGHQS